MHCARKAISAYAFHSSSTLLSLRTFIKHLAAIKPSTVKLRQFTSGEAVISRTSAPAFTSAAAAVGNPNYEALTSNQKHQIRLYIDTLLQWNQKMNLTAVKEENEVMERHVEDCIELITKARKIEEKLS